MTPVGGGASTGWSSPGADVPGVVLRAQRPLTGGNHRGPAGERRAQRAERSRAVAASSTAEAARSISTP
ncbi:hypothetical protein BJ969_002983 [Saccharopolyspora gloriosae]|uniref:Uncharacterized protein n=1 Tax=Saccharopolyspora gloriosae TaxID=455344 RepID=A0A840NIN7_9PSEU|nr:hypothetical protein [Saccharopolyspora gloriosae]